MKAFIILSCEGHQQDGFYFCNKVENIILDLEKIKRTSNYFNLIKYLDSIVDIFKQPCGKQHIVSNAIYKMYEFGYIEEKLHQSIAHFYDRHRRCNLILKVSPKEEEKI